MDETEAIRIDRGLGYMQRIMLRNLDIKANEDEMKDILWNVVVGLIEKADETKLRWKYVDIVIQVKHNQSSETRTDQEWVSLRIE